MIKVRSAQNNDFNEMGNILVKGWQTAFQKWIDPHFLEMMNSQETSLRMKGAFESQLFSSLVAEKKGKIIGYVTYGNRNGQKLKEKEIISFFIHPDYKKKKIGSILLQELEKKVVEEQVDFLFLWTIKENQEARIFYEKKGFLLSSKEQKRSFGPSEVVEVLYEKLL